MTPKTVPNVVDTPTATMSYSSRVKMQQKPVLQCVNHDLWSTISTPFVGMSDKTTHGFPLHLSASPFPAPRSSHFCPQPRGTQDPIKNHLVALKVSELTSRPRMFWICPVSLQLNTKPRQWIPSHSLSPWSSLNPDRRTDDPVVAHHH